KMFGINQLNTAIPTLDVTPVGILKDFHNLSLLESKGPTVIYANNSLQNSGMLIRISPGSEQKVMTSLKLIWREFFPHKWLETQWIDDKLAGQYESDHKLRSLFDVFSGLTILLAAGGIFALVVHTT